MNVHLNEKIDWIENGGLEDTEMSHYYYCSQDEIKNEFDTEYYFSITCEIDKDIQIDIDYTSSLNCDVGCDKVYFDYDDPEIDMTITN